MSKMAKHLKSLMMLSQRSTGGCLQTFRTMATTKTARKLPVVTLYTKDNCTLCDDAKILLTPLSHRFQLEEVDITLPENSQWFKKYRYEIPVFHLDGEFLMKNKVNLYQFEQSLTQYENKHGKA